MKNIWAAFALSLFLSTCASAPVFAVKPTIIVETHR